jgi:hypothetical protein
MCPLTWTIVVLRNGRRSRPRRADVAQLVAHHLAKVRVAGSNPVIRSKVQVAWTPTVEWPSGEATACKAVHTGSIPVSTSSFWFPGAISSAGERFPDTEEVTGSIPVSRTRVFAAQRSFFSFPARNRCLYAADPSNRTRVAVQPASPRQPSRDALGNRFTEVDTRQRTLLTKAPIARRSCGTASYP